mgnify:CR=1 FL=1
MPIVGVRQKYIACRKSVPTRAVASPTGLEVDGDHVRGSSVNRNAADIRFGKR